MELFTVENNTVIPNENTLLIHPFKDIWERDSSERKEIALLEFTYIEFLCSYKKTNPYKGYDEQIKEPKIRQNVFRSYPLWSPDLLINEGIAIYCSFRDQASPSLRFYLGNLEGARKLQHYYETVDLTLTNRSGTLINKPSDVAKGLSEALKVMNTLEALKEKVEQELFNAGKVRADRTVNPFEK